MYMQLQPHRRIRKHPCMSNASAQVTIRTMLHMHRQA
jgi:hypothetical protein